MRKHPFIRFTRFFLSMAIAFSALAGYIAFRHTVDITGLYAFLGVLFMAAGASALNQYQERHLDARMKRTRSRPLPSGELSLSKARWIISVLCVGGVVLLYFATTPVTAFLGIFNIFWYNAVYTPLKRVTPYAVIVGSVTGALPPMMGWTAGGGYLFSEDILYFALFMFMWQIPHFWLLLLRFGQDYKNAGFPSISSVITARQVQIVIFVWVVATVFTTILFPFSHLVFSPYLIAGLIVIDVLLISLFYRNIFLKRFSFDTGQAFRSLYYYQVLILILVIVQALN